MDGSSKDDVGGGGGGGKGKDGKCDGLRQDWRV